jgi:hypothetical protein
MERLDLDIGNYSLKEIERFFRLQDRQKYTASDIELRESEIRTQLIRSGMVEAKYVSQLVDFLSKAKQWLVVAKCENVSQPTTLPKNPRLDTSADYSMKYTPNFRQDELIEKPRTPFVHTMNTEYQDGQLNPLLMRTMTKCLTIDTRFRDNYYSTQSSDLLIQLPMKFSKVVSMQLSAIELPITFYGISNAIGNNFFYLEVTYQSSPSAEETTEIKIITLPDGNYNANDLVYTLNTILAPVEDDGVTMVYPNSPFSYIQLSLDITTTGSGTGKVYIQANPAGLMTISNIKMDFTRDSNGDVQNVDLSKKMGWNLGFTQPIYDGNTIYMGDTVVEPTTIRYVYLAVDDFNHSVNNHFVAAYNKSTLSPNILARISLKGSYFTLIMESDLNMITEPRKYFGPVDIQKLRIQLLDDHGRVLSMNNSNYSFCLTFKMLYE